MAFYIPELTIPQFISEEEASGRPRAVKRRAKLDWADSPDVTARREKAAEILDVALPSLAVQPRAAERKQLDNPLDLVRLDLSSAVAKPIPLLPPLVPVNVIDEGALLAEVLGAAPSSSAPSVPEPRAAHSASIPHASAEMPAPVTQQGVRNIVKTNVTEAAAQKLPKWRPCKVSTQDECFMQSNVDAEDGDTDKSWTSYLWGDAPKAKDNPYLALDPSDPARNRYRAIIDARKTLKGEPVQSTGSTHDGLCKWSYANGCRPADASVADDTGDDIMTFQAKWYLAELSLDINGVHEALLIKAMRECHGIATYLEAIKQTPAFRARMARVCFDRGIADGNCKGPCTIASYSSYGYNIRNTIRASLGNLGGVMDTRYCGYDGVVAKPSMCDHLKGVLGQNSPIVSACKLAESILAQPWIKALIGVFVPALLSSVITGAPGWLSTLLIPHFSKLGLSWALGDEAASNLNLDGFWPAFDSFRVALNTEYEVWRVTPDINASVRYYTAIMFYVGIVIYKGIRVFSVAVLTQTILSSIMGFELSAGTALFTGIAGYVTSPPVLFVVSLCIVFAVSKVLPLIPQVSDVSSLSVAIYNMFDIKNALGKAWGYSKESTKSLGGLAAHIIEDIALDVWAGKDATGALVHHAAARTLHNNPAATMLHSNAAQVVRSEEENQQHYARRLRGYLRVVAGDNHESLEKEISKSVVAALGTDAKVYMNMLCENNDNDVGGGGADGGM